MRAWSVWSRDKRWNVWLADDSTIVFPFVVKILMYRERPKSMLILHNFQEYCCPGRSVHVIAIEAIDGLVEHAR